MERPLRIEGIDPNRAYKPEPMRMLEEIRGNILPMERVTKAAARQDPGRGEVMIANLTPSLAYRDSGVEW